MNYSGSYRHLLKNSKAALLASIEIYNKPQIQYRDECFVILLLNAWELLLKAILSKKKQSIFYPKKRKEAYRTLSLVDVFTKAERLFPEDILALAVRKNVDLLSIYRDNAVHFYNEKGFSVIVYSLAQTSIKNFKDLADKIFDRDLVSEISWSILPLGFNLPIDPISYMSGERGVSSKKNLAAQQFMAELKNALGELETKNIDSERLVTVLSVKLESVKKITKADVTAGISSNNKEQVVGPLIITKSVDPNKTHPLKQKDVLERIGNLHNIKFTSHVFQAMIWDFKVREMPALYWKSENGELTKYSNEIIHFLKSKTKDEIQQAITDYKRKNKKRRK